MNPELAPFTSPEKVMAQNIDPALQTDPSNSADQLQAANEFAYTTDGSLLQPQVMIETTVQPDETASEAWMKQILNDSLQTAQTSQDGSVAAFDKVIQAPQVEQARHQLDAAFGSQAASIETTAAEHALTETKLANHELPSFAMRVAEGETLAEKSGDTLFNGHDQALDSDAQNAAAHQDIAGIRDRKNGMATKYMRGLIDQADERMSDLGIKSTETRSAHKAAIAANLALVTEPLNRSGNAESLDITNASIAEKAIDIAVGRELLKALSSPRLMTAKTRQQLHDLWQKDPQAASNIYRAAASQRSGNVSDLTAQHVGATVEQFSLTA